VDVVNSGKEPPVGRDRLIRYIIPYRATTVKLKKRIRTSLKERKLNDRKKTSCVNMLLKKCAFASPREADSEGEIPVPGTTGTIACDCYTSTSASRREGDREGERVGGKRLLEFFAAKVQNMKKSLSVYIPTAAATAATERTQVSLPPDCDRERVLRRSEGKTDLELKGNSGEASLWHLDTSPRSILRKGWTPENLSQCGTHRPLTAPRT
jgi:hypothetical protein